MNLQFLLPDVPSLGVWQLDTSSYWSMVNINSGIKLVLALCGRISMVPLLLRLALRLWLERTYPLPPDSPHPLA